MKTKSKKIEGANSEGDAREFDELDIVKISSGQTGYVKAFSLEEVFLKFHALRLIFDGAFESNAVLSTQENFGINMLFIELLNELELCLYGQKKWEGGDIIKESGG